MDGPLMAVMFGPSIQIGPVQGSEFNKMKTRTVLKISSLFCQVRDLVVRDFEQISMQLIGPVLNAVQNLDHGPNQQNSDRANEPGSENPDWSGILVRSSHHDNLSRICLQIFIHLGRDFSDSKSDNFGNFRHKCPQLNSQ